MPDSVKPEISVVVPAYNEEARLETTLPHLDRSLARRFDSYEIIVVDDGSTDGTASLVEGYAADSGSVRLISYPANRGKGHAVKRGVLAASGEHVLFSDADLSTPVREVRKLLQALDEGFDAAIGSRARRESRILQYQPFYRVLMGKTFNMMVRLLVLGGISDTQCGFKCFRGGTAQEIFSRCRIEGFGFDVEALYIAGRMGFRVKEVGVLWRNSPQSRVHPLYHSLQMMADMVRIRWYSLKGLYD
jgi:dolichyl-phosphate beta-glucosyltransferase